MVEENESASQQQRIPYAKLAWDKAVEEGRIMIDNRDDKEHRRFSVTLRPSQVSKSFKDCLNAGEFDEYNEKELLIITKRLIDLLGKRNPENFDIISRSFRKRLEGHYRDRARARRRIDEY